jgi:hypothetical protein
VIAPSPGKAVTLPLTTAHNANTRMFSVFVISTRIPALPPFFDSQIFGPFLIIPHHSFIIIAK